MFSIFNRAILKRLELWAVSDNRKPLVLRGARQTGKTTIVNMFAKRFNQYIYLNLDMPEDRNLFAKDYPFDELLEAIFFLKGKKQNIEKTLIFIDEIQQEPKAVAYLRYFHEQAKPLFVIAAGSLLESLLNRHISFPVGRTDYLIMRPVSFEEFLAALGEEEAIKMLNTVPIPAFAQEKLFKLFHRYALIGGMPEIVQRYAQTNDLTTLKPIYESLITAYLDDVEKYAPSSTQARVIRHVIKSAFFEAGTRIKFQDFGKSNYKSREVSESLQLLEKAFLLNLVYPTTAIEPPLIPDRKKSPKLQFLDTGLINYFAGLQQEIFGSKNLNAIFGGKIVEHIVGQELLAQQDSLLHGLIFWVRQKKQSNAEIDFLLTYENKAIPVEVKSGPAGRLRSLHLFMDNTQHGFAVRLHAGNLQIDKIKTIGGTDFYLLSLPYFLAGKLEPYLEWFVKKIAKI